MDEIYIEREPGRLTPARSVGYESEDLLQQLLVDHPDLLAGNQMNGSEPRRWLLVGREIGIPDAEDGPDRFALDHLFVDQDGVPTLVEVKRSTDTRIRREVVGQMLDYAANGLVYWRVDRLRSALATRLADERTAGDRVARHGPDGQRLARYGPDGEQAPEPPTPDEACDAAVAQWLDDDGGVDAFWSAVEQNLRNGRVRMVFVADVVPPELQRIIELLNGQLRDAEVLGVEVKRYDGDGVKAYVPRVIGRTGVALAKDGPGDTPSFPELYEAATADLHTCLARIEDWAERHDLEVRTTRRGRRFSADGTPLVWVFPGWEGIQVDVSHLAGTPDGEVLAEKVRRVCRDVFASPSKTPNSAWLAADEVAGRWERFEAEVLDVLRTRRGG